MTDLGLSDTVDAPKALFDPVRIPRQIVIDHQMSPLKVNAFPCRISGR